jgi:hypothetical protein
MNGLAWSRASKNKSRAKRPCSVGGMGGKEERFNNHSQTLFLDPENHPAPSLNGS